jgi:sterol desaturase/sphingolipid hydroxylase (fatty acid hydroxylase superfamily)
VDRVVLFWSVYLGVGALCTVVELVRPAHAVRYRDQIVMDLIALGAMQLVIFRLAQNVTGPIGGYLAPYVPIDVYALPLALRVALYFAITDLGSYAMHRLMHTKLAWSFHRFHHSPKQLYWLAGVRATLPQQVLYNLPYVVMSLFVLDSFWVFDLFMVVGVVSNHWMHVNVTWRSNWLEYLLVTPRYHQIHHSSDAKLHDGNYGTLFTIWDRLFGTYIDPDTTKVKKFGTGEKPRDPVLMILGV